MRRTPFILTLILGAAAVLAAQSGREVLRGEVRIDLEPVSDFSVEEQLPLDTAALRERAMAETAWFYGAMIYGWSFHYDIGERARGIAEELELVPLGTILPGDPRIEITDFEVKDARVYLWSDYRPAPAQLQRMAKWRAGSTRSAQGYGHGPLGVMPPAGIENAAERLRIRPNAGLRSESRRWKTPRAPPCAPYFAAVNGTGPKRRAVTSALPPFPASGSTGDSGPHPAVSLSR